MKKIDIRPGDIFGDLLIIRRVENSTHGDIQYSCICRCGNVVTKKATVLKIVSNRGNMCSCGCRRKNKNMC